MSNIRYLREFNSQYYKIGNQHVLIQPTVEMLDLIEKNLKNPTCQRLHIVEIYPKAIKNLIEVIAEHVNPETRIFIHIPKMLKDYARILEKDIEKLKDRGIKIKISLEGKEIKFKYIGKTNKYPKYFGMAFDSDKYHYYSRVFREVSTYALPKSIYKRNNSSKVQHAVDTVPEYNDPELFKDTIISNFKKSSPKGIVKSFNNDEEIWQFLLDNKIVDLEDREED